MLVDTCNVHGTQPTNAPARFWYALSSRDRLYITLEMAQRILSHHQVMPIFLDDLCMFGSREHSQNCAVTAYRADNRLSESQRGVHIAEYGRSGRVMQHCFGLRSVERSGAHDTWPWSIRQSSVYHSLDLESGQTTWIVVKANRLIEKMVRDSLSSENSTGVQDSRKVEAALISSLKLHDLIVQWSCNDWSRYIDFLENELQKLTRQALAITVSKRSDTISAKHFTDSGFTASPTRTPSGPGALDEKTAALGATASTFPWSPDRFRLFRVGKAADVDEGPIQVMQHHFSPDSLPAVHHLEEQLSEARNVLENNHEVLSDLQEDYASTLDGLSTDEEVLLAFDSFDSSLTRARRELRRQQARLDQLVKLITERKSLVSRQTAEACRATNAVRFMEYSITELWMRIASWLRRPGYRLTTWSNWP